MAYRIKEVFYSLQGEGFHAGRPAIFCRFSHCNLWTGKEADRASAICDFCDTDFVGTDGQNGGRFETPDALVEHLLSLWPNGSNTPPFTVLTGGEPLLQVDEALVSVLHESHFEIAVETNGTLLPPDDLDWICVSPKAGAPLILDYGNELKLVYPQKSFTPSDFSHLKFDHFFLQPLDTKEESKNSKNRETCVTYCLENPLWKLSLQTHKILGIN